MKDRFAIDNGLEMILFGYIVVSQQCMSLMLKQIDAQCVLFYSVPVDTLSL
jgi:hypothetical protein